MASEKAKTTGLKKAGTPADVKNYLEEEIRLEAYRKYQWRCESHEPGSEFEDWLTAEKLVHTRHAAPQGRPAPEPSK